MKKINNGVTRIKYLVISILGIAILIAVKITPVNCRLTIAPCVDAVNMESIDYQIQAGTVATGGGNTNSATYSLSTTLGETAAAEFANDGYLIKAGFQYTYSIIPFAFTISNARAHFSQLLPNKPQTANTTLTVNFGSAGEYQVTAAQEKPLTAYGGTSTIPNTSCDGSDQTCTNQRSATWSKNDAFGFGYTISGDDIPQDFLQGTRFRPFANLAQNELPVVIMSSPQVGKKRTATMTFKLNVSPIQQTGIYETVIRFVATPSY